MQRAVVVGLICGAIGVFGGFLGGRLAGAQQGIRRSELLTLGLAAGQERRVTFSKLEVASSGALGRHFHHGDEFVYVLSGSARIEYDASTNLTLTAGQSVHIPPEKIHDARSIGTAPLQALIVQVRPIDKPPLVRVP